MGEALKALAQVFVGAALTLPKEAAVDIVYVALEKLEHEVTVMAGAESKVIADGLHALARLIEGVVRTRGPIVPVLQALIALEDTCRETNDLKRINAALAKVAEARELQRGVAAEAG